MTTKGEKTPKITSVAVAVLRYHDEFLLAIRQAHQHQGGKLEFVGGKIEPNETAQIALIREVGEELGLDISTNAMHELGQICHDYGDKKVVLYIYQVLLTQSQYDEFRQTTTGLDGQVLVWLDKEILKQSMDKFPAANLKIFTWIS